MRLPLVFQNVVFGTSYFLYEKIYTKKKYVVDKTRWLTVRLFEFTLLYLHRKYHGGLTQKSEMKLTEGGGHYTKKNDQKL